VPKIDLEALDLGRRYAIVVIKIWTRGKIGKILGHSFGKSRKSAGANLVILETVCAFEIFR
jgi:hypothetical protein